MSKNLVRTHHPEFGLGWISRKEADRQVGRGVAKWKGKVCHFIADDRRAAAIVNPRKLHTYGHGFATLKGLAGTPVVAPIKLLTGKRPKESPRDWPDPVVLSVRALVPADPSFHSVRAIVSRLGRSGKAVLINGQWAVPANERPAGWEEMQVA